MDDALKKLIEEIERHGNVVRACRVADVPRRTFYHWLKTKPDFANRVIDAFEIGRK